ncbi:MAG: hypothetical protein K9J37_08300 [Saprospiraceae bacterium]|nr:hypothetical protein [Saprospiraceae bacterium]MCF8249901.1 hypothetical protein [Saprospiraceae bacterium]MCF8279314.1 hypothetical protein [Bacteroidales bacterium]MCF8310005.1 hypothetical protein [Saprospiraceae bacterium]MCF8438905.1 hypothetical protein [Saprospiraceae bacterium]
MGNTSPEHQLNLGEITIDSQGAEALFYCTFPSAGNLQLILQDALGRSVMTEEFSADETTKGLTFDVSNLKAGSYHAWIYINDLVFVRHFNLEKKEEQGLIGRFRSMFK